MNSQHKVKWITRKLEKCGLLSFIWLIAFGCGNGDGRDAHIENPKVEAAPEEWKSTYFDTLCAIEELQFLFECQSEKTENYQLELHQHFKDWYFINVSVENGQIDKIVFVRLGVGTQPFSAKWKKPFHGEFKYILPYDRVLYCYWSSPVKVKFRKTDSSIIQLTDFLTRKLWWLAEKDDPRNRGELDPEIWRVKGRRAGKSKVWSRDNFHDRFYFENLNQLVKLCRINEFILDSE